MDAGRDATLRAALIALAAVALATGCLDETRYFGPGENDEGVWAMAIDETTPAFFESEDGSLYLIEQRVEFDFREPTDDELMEMSTVGDLAVPYATLPFVRRGDIEIQIDYTIANLGDSSVVAGIRVNGINEFHEYEPGVQVIDEEVVVEFSGWEHSVRLGPGERETGTIREEEIDEVAVDLATVVNGAPNANQIVYFLNQSANDRRSQMFIPDLIPALTGVRVGLQSDANDVPLVLEFSVRVRDTRRVLVQGADDPWPLPAPTIVSPTSLAPPPMM